MLKTESFKRFSILLLITIVIVSNMGCGRKSVEKWDFSHNIGYAPYKIHIEDGWTQVKKVKYPAFSKKFSKDLPSSNFNIQISNVPEIEGGAKINLGKYVDDYLLAGLKKHFNATILEVKDFAIVDFPGKKVVDKHSLTIRGITREVFSETIAFIADDYVYTFTLGTFERDFETSHKEFEKMVKSFSFIEE